MMRFKHSCLRLAPIAGAMSGSYTVLLRLLLLGFSACAQAESEPLLPLSEDERWGYIDSRGDWQIEPRFSAARRFSEDVALVELSYTVVIPSLCRRGALIDRQGNVLTAMSTSVISPLTEGRARAQLCWGCGLLSFTNEKYGFVDKDGQWIIQPQFEYAESFSEGVAVVSVGCDRYGYIDTSGNWVIPPFESKSARSFSDGVAVVHRGSRTGLLDRKGNVVEAPEDIIELGQMIDGIAVASYRNFQTGTWGVGGINKECSWLFRLDDCDTNSSPRFNDGLLFVSKGDLCGYVDRSGSWAIKPIYHYATPFSDGLAQVCLGASNLSGYIATNGTMVISPQFKTADRFESGFAPIDIDRYGDGEISSISGYVRKDGTVLRKN